MEFVGQASSRGERHRLAQHLRAQGKTWAEIAEVLRGRLSVSARAAMRLAHGWTQQQAADQWGLRWPDRPKDKKWFSYQECWPNGGRPPSLGDLDKLALLYQCSVTDLLADLDYGDLDPATSVVSRRQDHEGVDRRDFLQGAVATAASALATGPGAGRTLARSDRPALVGLDSAVRRVTRLERASQYSAVDAVLARLVRDVEQAVDEAPPDHEHDAAALASRTYAVQAWALIKQDLAGQAEAAASKALRAASGVDDLILAAAAMRCLSEVHMRAGRHRVACDLAIEAGALAVRSGGGTEDALVISGAAYLSAAMACARAGDRRTAEELLDAAAACAARLGRDVSGVAVFGPANVDIHHVAIAMDLGDPVAALQHAEQTRPQMPSGFEERSSRYLIDLARAHAARHRDDDALHALLDAEETAAEEMRTHPLARSVVVDLLSRERRSRTPALRALASRSGVLETA